MIQYKLATTVSPNWIPYLPSLGDGIDEVLMKRAIMVRNEKSGVPLDIKSLSYLAAEELRTVRQEAIPQSGRQIQLNFQRTRWHDGQTYLWLGRKVLNGKGEGSSGLRFDHVS